VALRHLLRNAIDHGLELPEARLAQGKPSEGLLALRLSVTEASLRLSLEDDGAGFDIEAARASLATRLGADRVASLSEAEVLQHLTEHGGSTRASATEISGRGLGLSGAAQLVREAGGTLRVESRRGEGTTVTLELPPQVYAFAALTLFAGGCLYGIPLRSVESVVHLKKGAPPDERVLPVGETLVPYLSLAECLRPDTTEAARFAVVTGSGERRLALGVSELGEVVGVVPRRVPGIAEPGRLPSGLARRADGALGPLLDPSQLAARAAARAPSDSPAPAEATFLDVVLAEDSFATREVLRVLLEERGCKVRLAADGEEALTRVHERRPDVVVTDLSMPRRDGLALAMALRELPSTRDVPVVLLTSQADEATRARCTEAGVDALLAKASFDADALLETLRQLGTRAR